jgi:four helix bundle protein
VVVTDGRTEAELVNSGNGATGKSGFQDLIAWQKAMALVTTIYRATRDWPREELYGLTSQVRRAAVSIPSNLAEGHGRTGPREFAHHVSIAYGSLCELETQVLIAEQLGYSNADTSKRLTAQMMEVRRLIRGLLRSLRGSTDTGADR